MNNFDCCDSSLVPIKSEKVSDYVDEEEHYYSYAPVEAKRLGASDTFAPSSPTHLMDLSHGSERPLQHNTWTAISSNILFDDSQDYSSPEYSSYDPQSADDQRQR